MTAAIAIFVKTPSLSSVKTRLAETIGKEKALEFYHLAVECIKEAVEQSGLVAYWAVAEKEGLAMWRGFEATHTGEGELGERLHHIYSSLLEKHETVLLIGADSPQITPILLKEAAKKAASGKFVIGPARDGGFYLFAGNKSVEKKTWMETPYSVAETLQMLVEKIGEAEFLSTLTDVDKETDLQLLQKEIRGCNLNSKQKLKIWLENNI